MRSQIFISYSHKDKRWLQQLQVFLKPLEKTGKITSWDDTKIKAGQKWNTEIQAGLASAKVAVLLISADFLASDFIADNELPSLLEGAANEGAIILPIMISPCLLPPSLSQFQMVNDPAKPLIDMSKGDRDRVWVRVVKNIEAAFGPNEPTEAGKTNPQEKPAKSSDSKGAPAQPPEEGRRDSAREVASSSDVNDDNDGPRRISVGQALNLKRVRGGDIAVAKGDDPAEMIPGAQSIDLANHANIEDSEIGDIVVFKQQGKQGKDK